MSDATGAHELLTQAAVDIDALERLYRQCAPDILRWMRARVADADVARDLMAETFAQVVCSVERYRGRDDAAAAAWLWAIARNLLRRYYRRQRVEAASRHRLGMLVPPEADTPEEWAKLDLAVGDRLHEALNDLPTRVREGVWLRIVDELSYSEIADRQGGSVLAARQRVSRGMRHLATSMEASA
jgi:RNA polymerase sigma-70 factor (ECF subfamily)